MLSATRAAEALTESRARCAYRAVVWIWLWPSSFAITGRLSPRPALSKQSCVLLSALY